MLSAIFKTVLLLIGFCLVLAGCQAHQINPAPEPVVAGMDQFSTPSPENRPSENPWWDAFEDPTLDSLIRAALGNNLDILRSLARLDQAAALTRQARALRLPSLDLEASAQKEWLDGDAQQLLKQAGGALSWEVDVFNRLGSAALARKSEQAARMEDVEALRLSLSAEVAEAYYDAVEQRNQLALLQAQIDTDRELLELTELRFDAGLTASVDVLQQSSQLAETESLIPPSEAALRISENRLDVLTGQAPDALDRVDRKAEFARIGSLPYTGVPSDLLLNRPDLRALKNELVAADAEIGRAMAERLPRITLDGSYSFVDGPVLSGPAAFLLGTLVQPLLDWGARKAEVERNKALYVERLAVFSQAYLEAVEEVENTLYRERKQRQFLERLDNRRRFLSRTVEETRFRYTNGLTDFLPVLDAIKELQRIERVIVRQQRELVGFRIRLHRALGGNLTGAGVEVSSNVY
jgi:NodT family efflux transporter outer membrane factor (OMF) lipoprotein